MAAYTASRYGKRVPGMPMNLTFSVTNVCQSRCKTCRIWELYKKQPAKRQEELQLREIQDIFRSMGHVYIFNISGGEPFLRPDLPDIIAAACRYLTPGIIHIPTNAIAGKLIEKRIQKILEVIAPYPHVRLTVKPSLDHIGDKHDVIRGIPGNFEKVIRLFKKLLALQKQHPQLHAELGTVISNWNVEDVADIARYVTGLGADSYRNEIAEQRSEMFNIEDAITPSPDDYARAARYFIREIRANMQHRQFFHRITNGFRVVYYDTAIRIMKERRQVIPCYAGISNAHMTPYGDIWACCTLGYEKSMGNLRDFGYNFPALWRSPKAREVRAYIRAGHCHCPLANQTYSNLLLHPPSLLRVLREMLR